MLLPGSGSSALRQAVELGWVPVGLTPTPAGPWQWQSVGPLQEAGSLSHDLSGTLSPHGQHLLGDLQTHIGALPSESGSCLNGAPHTPPPAKRGKTRAGIAACPMSLTLKLERINSATRKDLPTVWARLEPVSEGRENLTPVLLPWRRTESPSLA